MAHCHCAQSAGGEERIGRIAAHGAEHHDWYGGRRHLLRAQRTRSHSAEGLRLVEADGRIHRGMRMAGYPLLRRSGADYQSTARVYAELQCSTVNHDEGLCVGAGKMERTS